MDSYQSKLASGRLSTAFGIVFDVVLAVLLLGFVFGLYFVGTIIETPATFAKVWALSFIVGYAAPKIWALKEDALVRRAERELDT